MQSKIAFLGLVIARLLHMTMEVSEMSQDLQSFRVVIIDQRPSMHRQMQSPRK